MLFGKENKQQFISEEILNYEQMRINVVKLWSSEYKYFGIYPLYKYLNLCIHNDIEDKLKIFMSFIKKLNQYLVNKNITVMTTYSDIKIQQLLNACLYCYIIK